MSTHDYVIDNQSAPAFRADLNNVLAAIASQNSSGTAPTVTFANMIWYDTTNNQIKKRNEANSAWITLGTIDETDGTFTPSGARALASQAQAEAGTDNATLMTPLRAAQAIAALTPTPPTTDVMGTIAAAAVGSVGTYAFLGQTLASSITVGSTVAGSTLRYASVLATSSFNNPSPTADTTMRGGTTTPSGTWRAMGVGGSIGAYALTLWLRIA